jgi:flagellar M-ring protein FliF
VLVAATLAAYSGLSFLGGALIMASIFIIMIVIRKKKKSKVAAAKPGQEKIRDEITNEALEAIRLSQTKEQALKKEIGEFSTNNPEIVAQLIRTWIKGDH